MKEWYKGRFCVFTITKISFKLLIKIWDYISLSDKQNAKWPILEQDWSTKTSLDCHVPSQVTLDPNCKTTQSNLILFIFRDLNKLQEGIGEKIGMFIFFMTIFLASIINAFIHGWELTLVILAAMPVSSIMWAFLYCFCTAIFCYICHQFLSISY